MAVYYKFKSAKDFDSIPIDGHFISVGILKEKIFETKHLGRGTDFDLVVTNAQTNEEYLDEAMLVPKNTSVLIRRVPGRPRLPIVTQPLTVQNEPTVEASKPDDAQPTKSSFLGADSSVVKYPEDSEWDEFGNDLYAIPDVLPVQASNQIQELPPPSKADEDSKIKALIDTPALDWQRQTDGFGPGRGFGRGMGGRMMGGRGFGRGGLERKTPPPGYVCHRCNKPGHFIQHCPTNGNPDYDVKRVKPPTGIPKSMLMATPDGSYALPSGAVAVLKPNEAAFEKEIEGMPSTRSVGDLPPELHCPLCKEVMKDAVLTSKCCFTSFCDKCIRDQIISKSMCVCGATNILADDLLPNKTLRDTINRILESNNSSTENAGSVFQVQDMESKIPQPRMEPKAPSPTLSAASKGDQAPPPQIEEMSKVKDAADQTNVLTAPQKILDKGRAGKVPDASEATRDSMSMKEPASQGSAPVAEDEVQQKPVSADAGKKKKKKKVRVPLNEMQWRNPQDLAMDNYMMPSGPSGYNPYWSGMQPGIEGFLPPFGGPMPYMGYGPGPLDVPFGFLPPDPFGVPSLVMPPFPPQRDLADIGMGMHAGPPIMSREEFEARKADLRRKRESERRGESKNLSRDREVGREMSSNGDISSLRPKSKTLPPPSSDDHNRQRHRSERSPPERLARDPELPRPSSKRKSDYDHDYDHRDCDRERHREDSTREHRLHHHRSEPSAARSASEPLEPPPMKSSAADRKQKVSVFSRISFPAEDSPPSKKRKASSSDAPVGGVSASAHHSHRNGYYEEQKKPSTVKAVSASRKASVELDYESSDEDRHFKRRPTRYESPPAAVEKWEEEGRHSRGSKERERDRSREERKHR